MDAYIDRLLADAETQVQRFGVNEVPTVYIGGGTPSVLGLNPMSRLLTGIVSLLPKTAEEFTVELNPESMDEALLRVLKDGGVNRISIGVQSFHDPSRRMLNRRGRAAEIPLKLRLAAEYFPKAFSADIIAGLPGQDETVLLRDVETLLSFDPAHVSLYSLTVEPDTPLAEKVRAGSLRLPDTDTADRLWLAGRDALEQAGYAQYEVSNFALPDKRSRHNIRYWRMENWLGMGPAASGTVIDDDTGTARRYTWEPDLDAYLGGAPGNDRVTAQDGENGRSAVHGPGGENLDTPTLMKETLMMGFLYIEGTDKALFRKRFGLDIEAAIPRTLAGWREKGLFEPEKTTLTRKGLLFLDPFLIDAFGELDRLFQPVRKN